MNGHSIVFIKQRSQIHFRSAMDSKVHISSPESPDKQGAVEGQHQSFRPLNYPQRFLYSGRFHTTETKGAPVPHTASHRLIKDTATMLQMPGYGKDGSSCMPEPQAWQVHRYERP